MIRSNENRKPRRKNEHCIVLGGGGARGIAHLGVMQAIAEQRIPVSRVVGISMGSLMAGLCILEPNPTKAQQIAIEFLRSKSGQKLHSMVLAMSGFAGQPNNLRWSAKILREIKKHKAVSRAVRTRSLLPSTILRELIDALIPDIDIRDLNTPLQIATVDLSSGTRVVLTAGSLRRAIRASMSIPGVFPAVSIDGRSLSDIGVYNSVPCDIEPEFKWKAPSQEAVIAVDVGQSPCDNANCESALTSMLRYQALAEQTIREQSLKHADLVIRPDFNSTQWFDFSNSESLIELGYQTAHQTLTRYRSDLNKQKVNAISSRFSVNDPNSNSCPNVLP